MEKRFAKVAKQVSELARLEVELKEEHNPAIADGMVAEATLSLKGVTLRARDTPATSSTRSTSARRSFAARSSATARSAADGARARPRRASGRPRRPDLDGGTQAAF